MVLVVQVEPGLRFKYGPADRTAKLLWSIVLLRVFLFHMPRKLLPRFKDRATLLTGKTVTGHELLLSVIAVLYT
jgi:hypothetical protein